MYAQPVFRPIPLSAATKARAPQIGRNKIRLLRYKTAPGSIFCKKSVNLQTNDYRTMEFFNDLVRYSYLNHAFWACILSGITCGIIGTYVVCRRLVFLSGGITHSSFGGLGIAFYLGINPILGAMVFAVLSALGIEWANDRGRIREDSAIGIIWSVGMAIGVPVSYTHLTLPTILRV